jgi:uncharacterized membrane protein (DUF373 family)
MTLFKKIVDLIIKLMLPLVVVTLLFGFARILLDLRDVFGSASIVAVFDSMISNILSMFVVIELLRSLIEYFEIHRLRLTLITDAALVFILREVMVGLYKNSIDPLHIASLALLILVVGGVRTLSVVFSPDRIKGETKS